MNASVARRRRVELRDLLGQVRELMRGAGSSRSALPRRVVANFGKIKETLQHSDIVIVDYGLNDQSPELIPDEREAMKDTSRIVGIL